MCTSYVGGICSTTANQPCKTKKNPTRRMWPREVITYGFSLVVFTGKPAKPWFPLLLGHCKVQNLSSEFSFSQYFCLLPSTCLWICESCPQSFPRSLSLSPACLCEAHQLFCYSEDPFKNFSNRFWNAMAPTCPDLSLATVIWISAH